MKANSSFRNMGGLQPSNLDCKLPRGPAPKLAKVHVVLHRRYLLHCQGGVHRWASADQRPSVVYLVAFLGHWEVHPLTHTHFPNHSHLVPEMPTLSSEEMQSRNIYPISSQSSTVAFIHRGFWSPGYSC